MPEMTENASTGTTPSGMNWRVGMGFVLFGISLGWPLLIPLLPILGLSPTTIAAITGFMVVAGEILLVLAAAIAGKEGFDHIKSRALGILKSYGPPHQVSRARYITGLVMFTIPLVFAVASPYLGHSFPGYKTRPWAYAMGLDVLLLGSLFVLGGAFWDKLRALFIHDATVVFSKHVRTEDKESPLVGKPRVD